MLDVIYYPVSAILWFWHHLFGTVLDPAGGAAWTLSVVFLVFSLRALLLKPALGQLRSQRFLQRLQPQLAELKNRHADDRAALTAATQQLHREHGVSALAGCLPAVGQGLVFLGLYHVLRSFNRTGAPLWLSAADNASTPNYVFSGGDVASFLHATLAGAPLSASITSSGRQLAAFAGSVGPHAVLFVAIPLMVLAAVATHFTARTALAGQRAAGNPQAGLPRVLSLWVFPAGALVGGPFLPVAVLVYWLSNNAWTLAQQHYVHRSQGRSADLTGPDETTVPIEPSTRGSTAIAPKPGARPVTARRRRGHRG